MPGEGVLVRVRVVEVDRSRGPVVVPCREV